MVHAQREKLENVARAIIDAYNVMDCQVMNVGTTDLAAGVDFITEMKSRAKFPLVSANIRGADSKDLLFKSHVIKRLNGLKIGFIGVAGDNTKNTQFEFDDPVESAQAVATELRDKVDLLVLLANVDDKTELALATTIPELDFLVRSRTGGLHRTPKKQNGVVIVRNSRQGKFAGILSLRLTDKTKDLADVTRQMARIDFVNKRLMTMEQDLKPGETLDEKFKDNPSRMNVLKRLRDERKNYSNEVFAQSNYYWFTARSLNENIEDEPEVAAVVEPYMPKEKQNK